MAENSTKCYMDNEKLNVELMAWIISVCLLEWIRNTSVLTACQSSHLHVQNSHKSLYRVVLELKSSI